MTRGKKLALTTPKDCTTVKSKEFGATLSAVVKKPGKNRILKYLDPYPDGQIFIYIADLSTNNWVYPKNFGSIRETVSK